LYTFKNKNIAGWS